MRNQDNVPSIAARRLRLAAGVVFVFLLAAAYLYGLHDFVTVSSLKLSRDVLLDWTRTHPAVAAVMFVAAYVALVSLSLPGSQIFSIAGGLMFGAIQGAALSVIAATIGATNIFINATRLFGAAQLLPETGHTGLIIHALRKCAGSYLLLLRLVPSVPFFAVNLGAAVVGVRISTFIATTSIGIIPASLAYSAFVSGIAVSMADGHELSFLDLLTPELLGASLFLGLLALGAIPLRRHLRDRP
jgi:uncharacterized membrane protein YdjX (TVP38/TMEM64 family)